MLFRADRFASLLPRDDVNFSWKADEGGFLLEAGILFTRTPAIIGEVGLFSFEYDVNLA